MFFKRSKKKNNSGDRHVRRVLARPFAGLEGLEERMLLSATVAGDKLILSGTSGDDQIVIAAGANPGELTVLNAPGVADNTLFTGIDRLIVRGRAGSDIITLQGNPTETGGGAMRITLQGDTGDDTITGSDADDKVRGGLGNDTISGGDGDDDIRGDVGNDIISGGNGNDNIRGDLGDDIINGEDGDDDIRGDVGNDIISGGNGNDNIRGDAGSDTIAGDDGDDDVRGGQGSDSLDGGLDDDRLRGGSGDDGIIGGGGTDDILPGETPPAAPAPGSTTTVNESENNDQKSRADRFHLFPGTSVELNGTSSSDRDKDFFVFTAQATGNITVNVQSVTGSTSLEVEDVFSVELFETEPNDGINSGSFNVIAGRTYFIRLRSVDDRSSTYRATLTA